MIGHKVFQAAVRKYPSVAGTLRKSAGDYPVGSITEFHAGQLFENVDAMDLRSVDGVLERFCPDVVVNCVGVIKQRVAGQEPLPSISINALLPHRTAAKLAEWGGRLVHISTDCVFDGRRGNYSEEDIPNANDLYGRTKALGEVVYSNSITLRTSIIGRELRNHQSLLDWFLSQNRATVPGYFNALFSGVTANYLADLILSVVDTHPELSGLFHVSSGRISKFALLELLRDAYGLEVTIERDETLVLDRSLLGAKLENAIGPYQLSWPAMLSQLVNDPTPYELPRVMSG